MPPEVVTPPPEPAQLPENFKQISSDVPPATLGKFRLALPKPVGARAVKVVRLVLRALANFKIPVVPVKPGTPKVKPPAPCTANVVLIVVAPFKLTVPVPVLKVPPPLWAKLPLVWLKPVMPLKAPPLMIRPLIVLPVVAALMAPEAVIVVAPEIAPAVVTVRPVEAKLKAADELPMVVAAEPVVLMLVAPVMLVVPLTVAPPFKLVDPATFKVPPKVVAPVPTVTVLAPVTARLPLKVAAAEKVEVPVTAKVPLNDPLTAVRLPVPSTLAKTKPEEFWSCNRSPPMPGVAPPLITATGVVTLAPA